MHPPARVARCHANVQTQGRRQKSAAIRHLDTAEAIVDTDAALLPPTLLGRRVRTAGSPVREDDVNNLGQRTHTPAPPGRRRKGCRIAAGSLDF
jgi:hypothetical protein